jgi:hypothetical protein
MEREAIAEAILKERLSVCVGGLVADVAALLQIMSVSPLDVPLHMSVCLLSVAIPALVAVIITTERALHYQDYQAFSWYVTGSYIVGTAGTGGAFANIFAHISVWYGLVFTIISSVGLILLTKHLKAIRRRSRPSTFS